MAESSSDEEFVIIAEPVSGRAYSVQARMEDALFKMQRMNVDSYKFALWLNEHGCEFCAHQVKLGLSVNCNHMRLSSAAMQKLRAIQT